MTRTTDALLALAGSCAALIAGCGGGSSNSNSSNNGSSKTVTSTSLTSSQSSIAASQSTTSTPPSLGAGGGAAAAADCQIALAAAKALTATQRSQVETYCALLKKDSASQLKGALKPICLDIVKDTVPAAKRPLADAQCAKL